MARFRNRDRSNRSGRGQIEHNVLEGLPINQYREIEITIGPNSTDNKPVDVNAWPELPMPRDSHMLPEHSQQLLRAARSGRTTKPPVPPEDDENEMKDEETEHKEVPIGFTIKKYVKVARHNEAPEPEYLAKRRKGLPSQYIHGQVQAPLRETKVKKLDAEGNVAVYKVLAPEGQAVEGEVAPTDAAIEITPVLPAPGTVVEGVGVVNAEGIVVANDILQQTPPRRRAPPPKKKKGGPGRGRKRVNFVEGAEGQSTPASVTGGDIPAVRDLKQGEGGSMEPSDRDTPMGEAGDDDESGEEGSDNEDQDQEDGTPVTPSKTPAAPTSAPVVEMTDAPEVVASTGSAIVTEESMTIPLETLQSPVEAERSAPTPVPETSEQTATRDRSSSADLPLSTANRSRQNSVSQLPTSATSVEPIVSEAVIADPIPAPVPSTETDPVPAGEPTDVSVSVPAPEAPKAQSQEPPSVPPSESEPDLLGSLEAELDKGN
ncbi:uncharacterized protein EKO05_0004238 [Ascochyta rabiei]|uniref:uncharacterized protein n=1 Tax=Didymella rabiei TaxID=5454 RepID=UPI0021FB8AB7|nr:uncharacterized protein EKO05_0004238 [Ascochyta rabiei]UPX13739.1 hypothetical protein EKO05_0004238 [Ascochyta rabiei]